WRPARAPIQGRLVPSRENIGAVIIDAGWHVAHRGEATLFGIRLTPEPLFVRNPLNVVEEIVAIVKLSFLLGRLPFEPGPRRFNALMLSRPFVPRFVLTVFFHERAKERVVIEPG